ncbi:tRNA (adenosine(37)-N6)-threonylcarbamoyltransferase complex ATPase subunit type 1 TsaE [Campylobacter sp. faydin G-105]|uniref:tRNA (adenosine(37)-N6)-threonylcarbamoyltransferase complex ATPase subunit type 1 TsaE n=1 Tax=Campylobacter anatolicus TaxID=2829105 RepID=UPI001B9391B8|nr:tRNA (adenosine(37)-N6)-threonylcarbamoyltransferase complex ATPase subunit type 1 TsaE [Campylobacter anatolicus]MBR8462795.1 tRNA (adenosine(37)-N6)-threonylcarbamoyltransferase complex ATPase subunit type 1 TsaE [Campylobacter anatolicus]
MRDKFILGLNELDRLVAVLPKQGVVLFRGDLASGKTTLIKAIAKAYGVQSDVTSPTFSVMQSYVGDIQIYHYDIYQNGLAGIIKNGLFENLMEDGLHLVEWGDNELENMLKRYGIEYCVVSIKTQENRREYEVYSA